jgi:hypothetical protein
LIAFDSEHRDGDGVADHQSFANPASQNQHCISPYAGVPPPTSCSCFATAGWGNGCRKRKD